MRRNTDSSMSGRAMDFILVYLAGRWILYLRKVGGEAHDLSLLDASSHYGLWPAERIIVTEEQRRVLRGTLREVHDRVHELYPKGAGAAEPDKQRLRNQLLVVDLAMHLADEVVGTASPDEQKIVERLANLLYGARRVARARGLEYAAELLRANAEDSATEESAAESPALE